MSPTRVPALQKPSDPDCLNHLRPPSRRGLALACRFRARSLRSITENCGLKIIPREERHSASYCQWRESDSSQSARLCREGRRRCTNRSLEAIWAPGRDSKMRSRTKREHVIRPTCRSSGGTTARRSMDAADSRRAWKFGVRVSELSATIPGRCTHAH